MKNFGDILPDTPAEGVREITPTEKMPEIVPSNLGIDDIGTYVDKQPRPGEWSPEDADEDADPTSDIVIPSRPYLNS